MDFSNAIVTYKVIKDLGRKWHEFKAFSLGLIDSKGVKLRSPVTQQELNAYDSYHKMIFNLKRILQKFVGKNATVQQITSLFLLTEGFDEEQTKKIVESLDLPTDTKKISDIEKKVLIESVIE